MAEVLVGAFLAGTFGLVGALYQHGRERRRWVNAELLSVSADMLDAANDVLGLVALDPDRSEADDLDAIGRAEVYRDTEEAMRRFFNSQSRMMLLASPNLTREALQLSATLRAVQDCWDPHARAAFREAEAAFVAATRAELGLRGLRRWG